ncbi:hypothetical protein EC973_001816 [Apophysomyces ossiformis]|uniref:Reverse transcriptase n=1 Tax=Apophysomyces ossiformis TaxID=679940 RepID=A0A8H7BT81_9FUNG|nr:hypothetical protein EC973_001816 [Apophysomyces ossiformis]
MSFSPDYNSIVSLVSNFKIQELQEQKAKQDPYYEDVLERAKAVSGSIEEVRILFEGIKKSPVQQTTNISLDDVRNFLDVAKYSMASSDHIKHWTTLLREEIEFLRQKRAYACLYAEVLKEELLNESLNSKPAKASEKSSEEDLCLEERVNVKDFESFLEELFEAESHEMEEELVSVRKGMKSFCDSLRKNPVTPDEVLQCVQGLAKADALSASKTAGLDAFKGNNSLLEDTAALLTKKLVDMESWSWSNDGLNMVVRRGIAGKYRYFADYNIIERIFLQYIGVEFAVQLKKTLTSLFSNIIQKKVNEETGEWFSIQRQRGTNHDTCLLTMLPDNSFEQDTMDYDGQSTGDSKIMLTKNMAIRSLSTEAQLYKVLYPEQPFTVLRTDIERYGSSIQHGAVLALLKFLGVSDDWLTFIKKFLEVPMLHPSLPEGKKTRRCGVLNSHMLSTAFGESLLFLMESKVYLKTRIRMVRIHDDIFLGGKPEQVRQAWQEMRTFAEVACLKFNLEKSGSAVIHKEADGTSIAPFGAEPLPQSPVTWSSLVMRSDGLYKISREELEPLVEEMKTKLDEAQTILSWIHVYNKYMAFFYRNFGKCSYVFGKQHIEQIAETLHWIQTTVFAEDKGIPLMALKRRFSSTLDNVNILDMWAYWPLQAGGLGLKDVFLEVGGLLETFRYEERDGAKPLNFLDFPRKDKLTHAYQEKNKEEKRKEGKYTEEDLRLAEPGTELWDLKPRTFEEYCAGRETKLRYWGKRYEHLMEYVMPTTPTVSSQRKELLRIFGDDNNERIVYAERIMCHYGHQLEKAFGDLNVVDMSLIPKILVETILAKALQWDE